MAGGLPKIPSVLLPGVKAMKDRLNTSSTAPAPMVGKGRTSDIRPAPPMLAAKPTGSGAGTNRRYAAYGRWEEGMVPIPSVKKRAS